MGCCVAQERTCNAPLSADLARIVSQSFSVNVAVFGTSGHEGVSENRHLLKKVIGMGRKLFGSLGALGFGALALGLPSLAANPGTVWSAALSPSGQTVMQAVTNSAAHGVFKGTLNGTTLRWSLTTSKLTGAPTFVVMQTSTNVKTGKAFQSLCGATAPGATPATAGVPKCTGTAGMTGTTTVSAAALAAMKSHGLYVNVETAKNPKGEIGGRLSTGASSE
jgi:hypothetical protein